jgi:hypothetical protein
VRRRAIRLVAIALTALVASPIWGFEIAWRVLLARAGTPQLPLGELPPRVFAAISAAEGPAGEPRWIWAGNVFRGGAADHALIDVGRLWRFRICDDRDRGKITCGLEELAADVWLSRHATRADLLQALASWSYFGLRSEGLDAASLSFFKVAPRELTTAQSALLAGVLPSPAAYNPRTHPDRAQKRRNWVLHRMFEARLITSAELGLALSAPTLVNGDCPR